ncbi:MAG: hypothetical protein HC833_10945 [Leptolyngbyaceae cyanobacterium RM1_406_9]|nr:hypothetical protein [Leptolyngbyaceae cyanobacterium RM1_406_9]
MRAIAQVSATVCIFNLLKILPNQQYLPPTDAKRVMLPIPIPCGGGLGTRFVPQWGSGGKPPEKIWLKSRVRRADGQDAHPTEEPKSFQIV